MSLSPAIKWEFFHPSTAEDYQQMKPVLPSSQGDQAANGMCLHALLDAFQANPWVVINHLADIPFLAPCSFTFSRRFVMPAGLAGSAGGAY